MLKYRAMKVLTGVILCLMTTSIFAEEAYPKSQKPRLRELIPDTWIVYPSIEPAIPQLYVMKHHGKGDIAFWGMSDDLTKCTMDNRVTPNEPIITMRHTDVIQLDGNSFSLSEEDVKDNFKNLGFTNIQTRMTTWGDYLVMEARGELLGKTRYRAWIGLNDPNRWVMFVHMIISGDHEKDKQTWENFINSTRKLEERELFMSLGQDMHDGYTHYDKNGVSILAIAENRRSDNLLAIMIKPENIETTFNYERAFECLMGSQWKFKAPCVKIEGVIKDGNNYCHTTLTVLTKEVDEFSFDLEKEAHPENVVVLMLPSEIE
jgi:hypothetical protein